MTSIILWIALAVLVLAATQIVVTMVAWRRLARRIETMAGNRPGGDYTDVPTSMLVTGLARVEQRLSNLERNGKAPPAPQAQPGDRAYDLAQRLARQGADAAQIAESCGIALHEAELLRRLHSPR